MLLKINVTKEPEPLKEEKLGVGEPLQKNIPGAGADKLRILVYIIIKRTLTSTLQVYVRESESGKRECNGSREGEGVSRLKCFQTSQYLFPSRRVGSEITAGGIFCVQKF